MDDDIPVLLVGSALLATSFATTHLVRRARLRSLTLWAGSFGFEYVHWDLIDFPTNILNPLGSWDKAHDVYRKQVSDGVLLFFKIEQGFGRRAYRRTIVARRYDRQITDFESAPPQEMLLLEYEHWRVLTPVRHLFRSVEMGRATILSMCALLA